MLMHNNTNWFTFFQYKISKDFKSRLAITYSLHSTFHIPLRHMSENRVFLFYLAHFTGSLKKKLTGQAKCVYTASKYLFTLTEGF